MAQATSYAQMEADRLAWYRKMRDGEPVWRDDENGAWNVFCYADVAAVLADHERFSSELDDLLPAGAQDLIEGNILRMDPPRHHRLRALVSRAFTPPAIARLEGRIAHLTGELLDRVGEGGRMELVADLSYPL